MKATKKACTVVSSVWPSPVPTVSAVVVALGLLAAPAQGTLITFQFAGQITSVDDPDGALDSSVNVGDPFTGSYTFDSASPDLQADDPQVGEYRSPDAGMTILLGTLQISADGEANQILIINRDGRDFYSLGAFGFDSDQLRISEFGVDAIDPTGTALDSDALPLAPPDLSDFATRSLWVDGEKPGVGDFLIQGELVSLIPEPATILLLGLAGLGLIRVRR